MNKFVGKHCTYPDTTGKRQAEGGRRMFGEARGPRGGKPLVSIITVCWNASKTIEKTIQSVMAQTYDNVEYVVVDGNSTDQTVDILNRYVDSIDYFVSEPDTGLYHAMNKGLELAQGEYILLLNADDWYQPETVARLVAAKEYSGCDFVGALARYINDNGTSHVLRTMPFEHSVLLRMPLRHETMLIPADLYDKMGPYNTDYPIIADYEYTIRLLQAGATYYEVREPFLNFSTGGVSNTATDRVGEETRKLMKQVFPFLSAGDLARMTDHANVGPETFIDLANKNPDQPDFVRAVRALLKDRRIHSGARWKEARLDQMLPDKKREYPKVSVIVPFYNNENSLASALDSALTQSLKEIEVICINDCGTDGSQKVVDSYAARDPRVRSLRNSENRGPGGSRNAGLWAACGEYVFFLDSDDSIAPGALEKLYTTAKIHGSTMVRGGFLATQQVHGQKGGGQAKYPAGVTDTPLINTSLLKTPRLLATTEGHWAALYDADFARTILYPEDIHVGEDSFFLIKAHALAPSISVLPEVVYNYKANANSTMNNLTASKYFDGLAWRQRGWRILQDAGAREVGENLLFNFWSVPYFEGLEKTLTPEEMARYRKALSKALSEPGPKGTAAIKDAALRGHVEKMLKRTGSSATPSQKMTIATFTTQDHGGAGLGSQRRVEALRRSGIDAHIYCVFQKTQHNYVHKLAPSDAYPATISAEKLWDAWTEQSVLRRVEHPKLKARELFSKPGSVVDFRKVKPVFDQASIVHMHWVSGLFDFEHTETLADKPVVWTLADMNAFTGGCHYSEGCSNYRKECRDCPLLAPGSDLAHNAWKKKRKAYSKIKNLHIICPSQWLADCASSSSLFGDREVHMIPNALPVARFTPTNRMLARQMLGLPLDRKLVVFGADSLNNRRKGGDILAQSIKILAAKGLVDGIEGLFFGANSLDLGIPTHSMGHVSDEAKMSLIYAAADVFAFPSREDNAPLTLAESMLSGTPVVAFAGVGNVPEMIAHKDTGYIARYEDAADFADGLAWALKDTNGTETLMRGLRGHLHAKTHNDPDTAIARHLTLYRKMLAQ